MNLDTPLTIEHYGVVVYEHIPQRIIQAKIDSLISPGAPFLPRTVHLRLKSNLR